MSDLGKTYSSFPTAKKKRSSAAIPLRSVVAASGNSRMNESPRSARLADSFSRRTVTVTGSSRSAEARQARTVAESFGVLGLPAAVLSLAGEVIAANRLFEALIPALVRDINGHLRWSDPVADRRFNDGLSGIAATNRGAARPIALRALRGKPNTMVHLVPIPADATDVFAGLGTIVVVSAVQPRSAPSLEVLRGLFDLSPAEARVAQGIAARCTVETIAVRSGVSRETVRSQLKNVLAKTGTKRQLDLAVLLLESCRFHPIG